MERRKQGKRSCVLRSSALAFSALSSLPSSSAVMTNCFYFSSDIYLSPGKLLTWPLERRSEAPSFFLSLSLSALPSFLLFSGTNFRFGSGFPPTLFLYVVPPGQGKSSQVISRRKGEYLGEMRGAFFATLSLSLPPCLGFPESSRQTMFQFSM